MLLELQETFTFLLNDQNISSCVVDIQSLGSESTLVLNKKDKKLHKRIHNYWDPIWIPHYNTKHQKELFMSWFQFRVT